ncbi:MAG: hypothetical protein HYY64_00415 [Candidatus Rokubacteria bacterium]|nr:hypothetical protein [Candidatus Rokubacteria bacterium]
MSSVIGLLVALGVLLSPLATDAQQPAKMPRIGVLASIRSPATEGFERGLKELGYVEGKNIIIEWRLVQGKFERLPEMAADLVRLKVDVILAPAPVRRQRRSPSSLHWLAIPSPWALSRAWRDRAATLRVCQTFRASSTRSGSSC